MPADRQNGTTCATSDQPVSKPAIAAGLSGAAMFNLAPMYLAAVTRSLALSDREIGFLMSAEVAGIALSALLALLALPRFGIRRIASIGLVAIVAGNLLSLLATDFKTLLWMRFLTGLAGDGLAYAAAIVALGQQTNATRAFALLSFSNMCFTGLSLSLLPRLFDSIDLPIVAGLFCLVAVAALSMTPGLPSARVLLKQRAVCHLAISPANVLALFGLLTFAVNLGAV